MKQLYFLLLTTFFIGTSAFAQQHPQHNKQEDFEHYKALKVSYLTNQLELTPTEAQNFWPIYNEYEKARFQNHQKCKELEKEVSDNYDTYSNQQFENLNQKIINQYIQEGQIQKKYNARFLKVLPVKKVAILSKVENDFRFKMIREYRQRENQKHGTEDRK